MSLHQAKMHLWDNRDIILDSKVSQKIDFWNFEVRRIFDEHIFPQNILKICQKSLIFILLLKYLEMSLHQAKMHLWDDRDIILNSKFSQKLEFWNFEARRIFDEHIFHKICWWFVKNGWSELQFLKILNFLLFVIYNRIGVSCGHDVFTDTKNWFEWIFLEKFLEVFGKKFQLKSVGHVQITNFWAIT